MKPNVLLLGILLFLSPAALGNNAGDDTDALLIAATYIGDGNGTIYRGYGTNPLDAAYTFKNGRIYKGDGRFTLSLDALYTIRRRKNFRGQQHLALRCRIFHRRRADIPGQRHICLVVRRVVYGKGRTVLQRGQFVHPRHSLHRQGRPGLRRSRGVHKYAIRCAVYDRIRGLLSIGGNPGARNLQTGRRKYTVYPDLS